MKNNYWKKVEWIRYWMNQTQTNAQKHTESHGIDCCNVLTLVCGNAKKPLTQTAMNVKKKSVSAKQSHYKSLSILIERTSFLFVAHFAPALDCLWTHTHTHTVFYYGTDCCKFSREKMSEHTHTHTQTHTQIEKSPCMSIEQRTRAFTSNYRIFLPQFYMFVTLFDSHDWTNSKSSQCVGNVSKTNHQTIIPRDCAIYAMRAYQFQGPEMHLLK